jgi:hypothetical protein
MKFILIISMMTAVMAETYVDKKLKLMWQDDIAAQNVKGYWEDALEYCDHLRLGGYKDWRLPNVRELYSLIDLNADDPAAIEQLSHVVSGDYWSSSVCVSDISDAWLVYFEDGVVNHYSKTRKRHIRCVRDIK